MVYLNRIYTKFGDGGLTQLGDGQSVPKTHPRVAAMGDVDEVNCQLGVIVANWCPTTPLLSRLRSLMLKIQNQLFDLGADLCLPEAPDSDSASAKLKMTEKDVSDLETWIDRLNESLEPLKSFILPGGSPVSAGLHLARAICRRAERSCWLLHDAETINPQIMIYLNRLSDLLFVMSRVVNKELDAGDILWQPGSHRDDV